MKIKKNYFILFYIFNICLLVVILLLAIPFSNFLSNINLSGKNNEYVSDQLIINPKAKSSAVLNRTMQINLLAEVDDSLDWEFRPLENSINIKIGESKKVSYRGKNVSNQTITSTAIFSVSPDLISPYLVKTECFCFQEQTLKPGESKIFTMIFFLDSSLDTDEELKEIDDLIFTYKFSEL
tara:strand:- start:553 stop:1095 length:543 start_codon:yes stop_codon:yes gene_type:complete